MGLECTLSSYTPSGQTRNWLTKHEPAIEPESAEAARQLAKAWEEFPVPQPLRKARSLPPREISSIRQQSSPGEQLYDS